MRGGERVAGWQSWVAGKIEGLKPHRDMPDQLKILVGIRPDLVRGFTHNIGTFLRPSAYQPDPVRPSSVTTEYLKNLPVFGLSDAQRASLQAIIDATHDSVYTGSTDGSGHATLLFSYGGLRVRLYRQAIGTRKTDAGTRYVHGFEGEWAPEGRRRQSKLKPEDVRSLFDGLEPVVALRGEFPEPVKVDAKPAY